MENFQVLTLQSTNLLLMQPFLINSCFFAQINDERVSRCNIIAVSVTSGPISGNPYKRVMHNLNANGPPCSGLFSIQRC